MSAGPRAICWPRFCPGTPVRVSYQDPNTGVWIMLAMKNVVKGMYPMCTEWQSGWDKPYPPEIIQSPV